MFKNLDYKTILFIITLVSVKLMAQEIRPVRDSVGFCWLPSEMDQLVKYLELNNKIDGDFSSDNMVAAISPHDDYLFAGNIYYSLYKLIKTKEVVIFGVTHGTVRKAVNDPKGVLILDDYPFWQGPYSNVQISPLRNYIESKLAPEDFIVNDTAQSIEHSIEALVPFLQYYNRDVKITPVMVTGMPFDKMEKISDRLAQIISAYMAENRLTPGKDIFFLISSDANHYGTDFNNEHFGLDKKAHEEAVQNDINIARNSFSDTLTISKIKTFTNILWNEKNYAPLWCGKYSIPFGLLTANKVISITTGKTLKGKILRYSDSWTEGVLPIKHTHMGLTAPFSLKHWVGYLAAGFYIN